MECDQSFKIEAIDLECRDRAQLHASLEGGKQVMQTNADKSSMHVPVIVKLFQISATNRFICLDPI